MNSSASRWRKASSASANSATPRISWVLGPGTARILQLACLRVAIEEGTESALADRHEQAEVLFEQAGILEPACRDRLVADVTDQLLGHLTCPVLGRVQLTWAYPLLVNVVVLIGEVRVERLRDRAADDRLDLEGQRLELFVAAAKRVGRVDYDLALEPVDLSQRVGDLG